MDGQEESPINISPRAEHQQMRPEVEEAKMLFAKSFGLSEGGEKAQGKIFDLLSVLCYKLPNDLTDEEKVSMREWTADTTMWLITTNHHNPIGGMLPKADESLSPAERDFRSRWLAFENEAESRLADWTTHNVGEVSPDVGQRYIKRPTYYYLLVKEQSLQKRGVSEGKFFGWYDRTRDATTNSYFHDITQRITHGTLPKNMRVDYFKAIATGVGVYLHSLEDQIYQVLPENTVVEDDGKRITEKDIYDKWQALKSQRNPAESRPSLPTK